VDDGKIFCETREEIKEMIEFVVKDLGNIETLVGCKKINNKTNDNAYIHQPKLLKHLKQEFGALVESLKGVSKSCISKNCGKTSR
jgi:threonyl-tRNA synthetase